MTHSLDRTWLTLALGLGTPLLFGLVSCEKNDGGLALPGGSAGSGATGGAHAGSGGRAGGPDPAGAGGDDETGGTGGTASGARGGSGAQGGSGARGGSSSDAGSTSTGGSGATAGTTVTEGGAAGEAGAGTSAESGAGGEGGEPAVLPNEVCIYHSPPALPVIGDAGAPPPNGVDVATNAFVGPYLTDLAGLALYIYGADQPGDCNTPPITNCFDDCVLSWPIFDAGERTLDPTLDDGAFGTIARPDGKFQTTYLGWPLYRYKSDTAANTINGQGKAKTWFAAEVALPNLMIMRGPTSGGGIKYLGDDHGHTLYALSGDIVGTTGVAPVSNCTAGCADAFLPYAPGAVYPVTTLEPHDIALFFRGDGTLQTSFKGAPLYYAKGDTRSGDVTGLTLFGGALVTP